jgi:ubiquinone/menaquinone biosynthesis C-methylase UbiE
MHTATKEAATWWAVSRKDKATEWVAGYQNSLKQRHRTMLVDTVRQIGADTLLEVGCHCGPNLVAMAEACPALHAVGIDVNGEAIAAGQAWLTQRGLTERVTLKQGAFPGRITTDLPSGAFDVVLTCYSLAYVAPPDLDEALYELGRLASKAVILAEPMDGEGRHGQGGYQEWAHDYHSAIQWIGSLRGRTITTVPVAPPVDRLNAILVAVRDASNTP